MVGEEMNEKAMKNLDEDLDAIKCLREIVLVSYPVYAALVKALRSKAKYAQINGPHMSHHVLQIGELFFCPDRRIED